MRRLACQFVVLIGVGLLVVGCGDEPPVSNQPDIQNAENHNAGDNDDGEDNYSSTNDNDQNNVTPPGANHGDDNDGDDNDGDDDGNGGEDDEAIVNDEEGPDAETCDELCDQVYNTCEFTFYHADGTPASEDECYYECLDGIFEDQIQCVLDAGCSEDGINQCLDELSDDDDGDDDIPPPSDDLDDPCDPDTEWPDEWAELEEEVLELTNDERAEGAVCGDESFDPAPPLEMNETLRCAARRHSQDMADREYFSHYTPEGESPAHRLDDAGYTGTTWGENIARNPSTAQQVVDGWMNSPGHCANIMRAQFEEIGVGFADDPDSTHRRMWTQKFGAQ